MQKVLHLAPLALLGACAMGPDFTQPAPPAPEAEIRTAPAAIETDAWTSDAEKELRKIPFFVRGKARRNTERYARERGLGSISVETLYDAKAHFGR